MALRLWDESGDPALPTPTERFGFRARRPWRHARSLCAQALLGLLLAPVTFAHIMSMSSGELKVAGLQVTYELRMPLYEAAHLADPEASLLKNFRVFSDGLELHRTQGACAANTDEGVYRCESAYALRTEVDRLEVECTYAAVTVPNHVHVLRAVQGDKTEQAIFDFTFTRSEIRFTPPTFTETLTHEMAAGFVRVLMGPFQVLFLLALVLAGRNRRELVWMGLAFIGAEIVTAAVMGKVLWAPSTRFVEAAAALTVAYLAVEVLALPEAGHRWMVAAGMGVIHGMYFGGFLQQSEMHAAYVLSGAALGEILLLGIFAAVWSRLKTAAAALRPVQAGAAVLFVVGIVWFVMRLRG